MEEKLNNIIEELETVGYVWIDGNIYRDLLLWKGATLDDLEAVESGKIHNNTERDPEPVMHFRQIAFQRLLLDASDRKRQPILANCQAVTQIKNTEIASDHGAKVNFKRSGTRHWPLPPLAYVHSTVSKAMGILSSLLHPATHHYQSNINHMSNSVINDQLIIRINKNVLIEEAEPTPEGVHQDGTEISSVTMIKRHNIASGGESRFWNLDQPTGNYDSDVFGKVESNSKIPNPGFNWGNCLLNKPVMTPWDTIIFNDREVKHEARAFQLKNNGRAGYRDVIVNFVRKPLIDGSDKIKIGNHLFSIN